MDNINKLRKMQQNLRVIQEPQVQNENWSIRGWPFSSFRCISVMSQNSCRARQHWCKTCKYEVVIKCLQTYQIPFLWKYPQHRQCLLSFCIAQLSRGSRFWYSILGDQWLLRMFSTDPALQKSFPLATSSLEQV